MLRVHGRGGEDVPGDQPVPSRFEGGDPRSLPGDEWLRATVVFNWMAFKDFSSDDRILSELADGMRGKDGSRANWPEGSANLKEKMAALERSCDWIIEKIRTGKLCAYIKSDREMRQLPSHNLSSD
jgi:hypothetical protein